MGIADAEMERDHGWNDEEGEGEEDKQTQQNEQQMMMMIMRRVVECCWLSWARLDQSTRIG